MKRTIKVGDWLFNWGNTLQFLVLLVVMGYPFLYIASHSLSSPTGLAGGLIWYPHHFSLEAYKLAFNHPLIWQAIFISVAKTVVGPLLMILVTSMAAYCLSRDDLVAVRFFRKYFVLTLYFSVGLIPVYLLMLNLQLIGSFWVYVIPASVNVFNMILIKTYIENLPRELEEAAVMDGASDFYLFWRIVFPLCIPVIAAVSLFAGVAQWNGFFDTQIYNAMRPDLYPLSYILYQTLASLTSLDELKNSAMQGNAATVNAKGLKMAVTMITLLPIVMLYPFLQRFFLKGLLIGSIKG